MVGQESFLLVDGLVAVVGPVRDDVGVLLREGDERRR